MNTELFMNSSFSARESTNITGRRISDMSPVMFCALLFGWAMIGLPITIAVSAWMIYRVVLEGQLDFWEWSLKMINHKWYITGRNIVRLFSARSRTFVVVIYRPYRTFVRRRSFTIEHLFDSLVKNFRRRYITEWRFFTNYAEHLFSDNSSLPNICAMIYHLVINNLVICHLVTYHLVIFLPTIYHLVTCHLVIFPRALSGRDFSPL